ncbi:septation protein SepH [Homoserinibacter sp. YIM 151385]|uniref:septation protein SepH n=1 Tax=Homoserinibacter sp. YIM 151385 TaxID=2985506 RepID=UPI0022F05FC0|nr:septation protein SepH [Homoserinibacter sp. YIM 151385]WBU38497.1 septation protein SepH [Homoserinibacter sp. YIM 151385]
MQELKVIGIEDGSLVLGSSDGARYRVAVDETLQNRVRQALPSAAGEKRIAPREVQAHIRAGMSAEEVAKVTGASLEYVQRFEGPVVAEREYVIESALNVRVHTAGDTDPAADGASFGSVIRQRLADAGASEESWSAWKEAAGGWVVALGFTAETVERSARWSFEPRKRALSPLDQEAVQLSQQGDMPQSLIPRLRAVPSSESEASRRFDSGAFAVDDTPETGPLLEPVPFGRQTEADMNQTADLLEALRRRRGEREVATPEEFADHDPRAEHPSGAIRLVDVPLDGLGDPRDEEPAAPPAGDAAPGSPVTSMSGRSRKGRASMPSWDEIVFGARSDED